MSWSDFLKTLIDSNEKKVEKFFIKIALVSVLTTALILLTPKTYQYMQNYLFENFSKLGDVFKFSFIIALYFFASIVILLVTRHILIFLKNRFDDFMEKDYIFSLNKNEQIALYSILHYRCFPNNVLTWNHPDVEKLRLGGIIDNDMSGAPLVKVSAHTRILSNKDKIFFDVTEDDIKNIESFLRPDY